MRFNIMLRLSVLLLFTHLIALPANAEIKIEKVPGAGPSTMVVTQFFERLEMAGRLDGYRFTVPQRSVKHAGGINASSHYLFGRTGRPLTDTEKAAGKFELPLARIPLVFVTGSAVAPQKVTREWLKKIYTRKIIHWEQSSGHSEKIELIGREKTEAALSELVKTFPFLALATYDKIFTRDHQLVNYMKSPSGRFAIGFGAEPNLRELNRVDIEGVEIGLPVGLVIDDSHRNHPIVKAVTDYAKSKEWQSVVRNIGLIPLVVNP